MASAWGTSWSTFWGNSWGSVGAVTPPVVETPPPPQAGGVGVPAWRDHYKRKKLPKKKRKLLDELDDALLDLRGRIEETVEEEAVVIPHDLLLLETQEIGDLTIADLRTQLAAVKAAIEEMDDEDAILLALH